MKSARARSKPYGLKWKEQKGYRAWHFRHDLAEDLRWLVHGPDDQRGKARIGNHHNGSYFEQYFTDAWAWF